MKSRPGRNIYLSALFRMMLICASIHMILLIIVSLLNKQMVLLNLFNILDLDLVYPGIEQGKVSAILSVALGFAMYFTILVLMKRQSNNARNIKNGDKDQQ